MNYATEVISPEMGLTEDKRVNGGAALASTMNYSTEVIMNYATEVISPEMGLTEDKR